MTPKLLYQLNKIVNQQLHLTIKCEDEIDLAIVY